MIAEKRERGVVIIPTYNEADNIQRVIRGVFDQALPLDVLVVDDASPDGTADLVMSGKDGVFLRSGSAWRREPCIADRESPRFSPSPL